MKGICEICKKEKEINIHHIKYKMHGGTNDPDNLIKMCIDCHKAVHVWLRDPLFSKAPEVMFNRFKIIQKYINFLNDKFIDKLFILFVPREGVKMYIDNKQVKMKNSIYDYHISCYERIDPIAQKRIMDIKEKDEQNQLNLYNDFNLMLEILEE